SGLPLEPGRSFAKSETPTTRSVAPSAYRISAHEGASATMRFGGGVGPALAGAASAARIARSPRRKEKPRRGRRAASRGSPAGLDSSGRPETDVFLGLFGFFEVVLDAEAHAGRGVHLPGGFLRVLELGEALFHLRELLLDVRLQ